MRKLLVLTSVALLFLTGCGKGGGGDAPPADAGQSTVTVTTNNATANGTDTDVLQATIKDANGNPVQGETVTFAATANVTFSSTTCSTAADGACTVTVTSTVAGSYSTAVTIDDGVLSNSPVSYTFVAGAADAGTSTVSASPASVIADGTTTSTVTVTVKDANGNLITGSAVTLAQGAGSSTISTVTDNSDGTYTATVTSTTAEMVTYTATADSTTITDTADVTFTAGAATTTSSTVTVTTDNAVADGSDTDVLQATIKDANGNPVQGETVTFAATANVTFSSTTCSTAADGTCSVTAKTTVAGSYTTAVSISAGVLSNSPANYTFTAGAVSAANSIVTASPSSVTADGSTTSTVTVTVKDANNNAIKNATVSLAQGAGSSTISVVTNHSDGTYTFTVTNTTAEAVTYTATADTVVITDTADVTFTPTPPTADIYYESESNATALRALVQLFSASTQGTSPITGYRWSRKDTNATLATTEDLNMTASDISAAAGTVTVTLTVTDSGGLSDSKDFNLTIYAVAVKKTGQTTSYTAHDDGDRQRGVDTRYERNATTETVMDHLTGLMWQDDVNVTTTTRNWQGAIDYCAALDTTVNPGGGYDDWRLPTRQELVEITDYGWINPAISAELHGGAFKYAAWHYYWSATAFVGSTTDTWFVDFSDGFQSYASKPNYYYVRCVRAP